MTFTGPPFPPGRDGYRVRETREFHVHNYAGRKKRKKLKPAAGEEPYPSYDGRDLGLLVPVALGVLMLFAVAVVVFSCGYAGADGADFPRRGDPPPDGALPARAVGVAADQVASCVREVVLRPATCPQRADDSSDQAARVRWTLHGDPADGAQWRYVRETRTFSVAGRAVMSVSYVVGDEPRFELHTVPFLAEVAWAGGALTGRSLHRFTGRLDAPARKRDPGISTARARDLVRAAFVRCAAAKRSPMPPHCPAPGSAVTWARAEWALNGDPAANAVRGFDPETGLVHLRGSYSATVRYRGRFTERRQQNGDYDASISIDGGRPRVIRVAEVDD